jgi:hypothetical protein
MSRQILLRESPEHADLVDQLIFARLQDVDGSHGNGWSGVLTDGTRYGVLWASPVSDLFGLPEDFPELQLVEESPDSPWIALTPPADENPTA